jgi:hypothetical protein
VAGAQKCPSAGDLEKAGPVLVNVTRNWSAVLLANRQGKPLPPGLQELQSVTENPREFRTLIYLMQNPQVMRQFFRQSCHTAEVAGSARELFQEYVDLKAAPPGNLLICRDRINATETFYECAAGHIIDSSDA